MIHLANLKNTVYWAENKSLTDLCSNVSVTFPGLRINPAKKGEIVETTCSGVLHLGPQVGSGCVSAFHSSTQNLCMCAQAHVHFLKEGAHNLPKSQRGFDWHTHKNHWLPIPWWTDGKENPAEVTIFSRSNNLGTEKGLEIRSPGPQSQVLS